MTNAEAVTVMIDVATKRKPHTRTQIQDALLVLEGGPKAHRHTLSDAPAPAPAPTLFEE